MVTKEKAIDRLVEILDLSYSDTYSVLHNKCFNYGEYINDTNEAKKIIDEIGIYKILGKIQEFTKGEAGYLYIDLSDPKDIINEYWYIIGIETMIEIDFKEIVDSVAGDTQAYYNNAKNIYNDKIIKKIKTLKNV